MVNITTAVEQMGKQMDELRDDRDNLLRVMRQVRDSLRGLTPAHIAGGYDYRYELTWMRDAIREEER